MPKMDGAEFLKIVKADKALKKIPVVILTTSNSDRDVIESFELGAAGYMVKSVDYEKFVETIKAIDMYWTLSRLPSNGE
jgi:DNA-binding NarL/FixJ family response regulator